MSLMSGFYVVTAHLGGWIVRFGAWVAGISRVEPESSLGGNFAPVYGDPLLQSIVHGLADAGADLSAAPFVRDQILDGHTVVHFGEQPSVHLENGFFCAGGASRHEHTSPAVVRAQAAALLSISIVMEARHE